MTPLLANNSKNAAHSLTVPLDTLAPTKLTTPQSSSVRAEVVTLFVVVQWPFGT